MATADGTGPMTLSAADRLDILDLIGRADAAATARNADAYVGLFTDDALLDGGQGRHAGQNALRAAVGPIWAAEGPATLHLTLNPVIDSGTDSDEAVVSSILLITDTAAPFAIHAAAAITQTVRRTAGTWRIARRTVGRAGKPATT
jgi:ketosteroid isomerase-like protein